MLTAQARYEKNLSELEDLRKYGQMILNIPAFTFEEDDSFVECRRCFEVE